MEAARRAAAEGAAAEAAEMARREAEEAPARAARLEEVRRPAERSAPDPDPLTPDLVLPQP